MLVAVCERQPENKLCQGISSPNTNRAPQNKAAPSRVNAPSTASSLSSFCSRNAVAYQNCQRSRPPLFATEFCTYYNRNCPGAGPIGTANNAAAVVQDAPVTVGPPVLPTTVPNVFLVKIFDYKIFLMVMKINRFKVN